LTVSQTNGDWHLIDLPNAKPLQRGWIRKSDVEEHCASFTPAGQIPHADQYGHVVANSEL
jgi:hypothetical protein